MIEIRDDKFYILDTKTGKWVFQTEDDAINKLKEIAKKTEPENTKIVEISIGKDEWSIVQVPWSKIAMKLL